MKENKRSAFGTEPLGQLLRQQAIPASAGILVMSIYGIVDTIFVGLWVGSLGIAAITVVQPITFFIASIGMAIGVGGASIISRAFGEGNDGRAFRTFGNQVGMTLTFGILFVLIGFLFIEPVLSLFGGRGEVTGPAREYFEIVLLGVPFLAWAMMSNNVIRAEGYPRVAMMVLVVPAIVNIVLDPVFIIWLDMGIAGAAWATTLSYIASAAFSTWFFRRGGSQMSLDLKSLRPDVPILKEMFSLGSVTFARQGTISILSIILNNSLFVYGGELGLSIYGIIGRLLMFTNFPVLGITQGFIPIVGYNYGAGLMERVNRLIRLSMTSATLISFAIFAVIMIFAPYIVSVFTNDPALIEQTIPSLRKVFLATPLLAINLLGGAYFQAVGRAKPAFILSLSKQGFLLIPLILLLPLEFGIDGIWYAFPIADLGAAGITGYYFKYHRNKDGSHETDASG
ncbi:MATE family efflux transporter [Rhodohalobacter mucosus]|uniref:Multidrug export protein MepA n=1 Tax=Rhodohalobacter mucosus TaxID=2079485 RepID=A0A316TTE2_9BACT|nr:MATE family efflux transporter [Rhodohalobacter mucosus]